MSDPKDLVAASLRRQFSPPPLDALAERIEAEAARLEREQPQALHPLPPVDTEPSSTWPLVLTAALAVAAAVLLMLIRPWQEPGVVETKAPPVAEARDVADLVPPTASQRAGAQLEVFLGREDSFLGGAQWGITEPPAEVCGGEAQFPHLLPGPTVEQLGECGGLTGVLCADYDLPADRLLLVQLNPEGQRAIVCIERPWTDPHPELPLGSGYNIFRRELGDHVLYEVTPLDEPRALDLIRL